MADQNILLVQTGFLGDVVLSTPVISSLKKIYPDAAITLMTTPLAAPLVEHHPGVTEVIRYDKRGRDRGLSGLLGMARLLRSRRFFAAFSLHKSYRTALLLAAAGIRPRYGFSEAALPWLYTKTAPRTGAGHEVLRNLALLRVLGREPESLDQSMQVSFPAEMAAAVSIRCGLPASDRLVGIAPGSVWATKRWTAGGFAEVARRLADDGWRVVLIGGPDDAAVGAEIEGQSGAVLYNMIGKLSLLESACLIAQLRLLISNDSAPLHLASAARTPVVALFCATVPEFGYGPWGVDSEILGVSGLSCRPCGRHGGQTCPTGTHACQRQLSADTVFQAAVRLIERSVPRVQFGDRPLH